MATTTVNILVPDLGGAENVDVIEILVAVGDTIAVEDPIVTLESDKASMEVPSSAAGVVQSIAVAIGDKLAEGSLILTLSTEDTPEKPASQQDAAKADTASPDTATTSVQEVKVPDLGGADQVDVIEVNVKPGDQVAVEDALVTLESDKASMEVPSPLAGTIVEVKVSVGDKLSVGSVIATIEAQGVAAATDSSKSEPVASSVPASPEAAIAPAANNMPSGGAGLYVGPAVRRIAREFGVDLTKIQGSGVKGRIVKEDLQQYVKQQLQLAKSGGGTGFDLPELPQVDFTKFGVVTEKPLSKINKLSGSFLHRNWLSIPHVTQFEEVDITDMEAFRQKHKVEAAEQGVKLTPIVFVMKALLSSLKEFPTFNASLSSDGQSLVLKQYYNIGVAVDTPNGLVVPVIRNIECKGTFELAAELGAISKKAREKGLTPAEMQGGCMTISSLGGIGGTAFTPIINAPEVAILGLSRSYTKPVFDKESNAFQPRLTLPVSLSYDHRVIDGAEAARFIVYFASRLADLETLIL